MLLTLAQLLGVLESHRPAVWRALLHFWQLQAQLIRDFEKSKYKYVREQNASNKHLQDRNGMLVNKLTSSKRKSDRATISRYNNLHQRIQNGFGCGFRRFENERQMVRSRENVTHKCVRTQVGSISNSKVAKEPAPNSSQSEHGQLNSCLIHQPSNLYY